MKSLFKSKFIETINLLPKLHTISCFLILFFSIRMNAQPHNYTFQHLTTRDGLGSNFIQSIFQDSKGFYWIGTTSGLQIFDGYNFSKPLTAGKDLLVSPQITETRDGMIWISTGTSLYRYNRINEHFTSIIPEANQPKMKLTVIEDSLGNIWLLNQFKLYKYDLLSGKLISWIDLPFTDPAMTAGAIAFNKSASIIWIQNGTILFGISPEKKKIITQETMPALIANIWVDGDHLWLSFWTQYLCRYNVSNGAKNWFTLSYEKSGSQSRNLGVASCFGRDKSGRLWIGSIDAGFWYFDEPANKLVQLKTDNLKPTSLHYNEVIYSIGIDKEENIWVGSDRGLNIFNPTNQRFYTLDNSDLPTKGIPAEISQKPFETSTQDILINTHNGGWLIYDSNFKFKQGFSIKLNSSSSNIDTFKTSVDCFAEDKNGRIWITHRGGLVGIYQPRTGKIKYEMVQEFRGKKVSNMQCDAGGNMWFTLRATDSNLVKWNSTSKKLKIYNDTLLRKGMAGESSILITRQGDTWVQTFENGIYRFDPVKEKIAEIYRDELPPYYIPTAVHGINQLNDSILAVASYAKGFFLVNTIRKTMNRLGTDEGLPSNLARAIATDSHNNYWLAMLSDLVRMNPLTNKIVSFDEDDGVLNKSFVYGFTKLHDGRLIIYTNTGLLYFHPDSIKTYPPPPDVLITGLKISSKPILFDSILLANNNQVPLSYNQNFLAIEYVSISYLNRKKNQYFYKLQGLDKDWIEAGTQLIANYTNLSPGKYIFMVRCQNRDGLFSKNITYLNIIISPPLWFTWWAYTLYGIAVIAIAYFIYRNHIRALEKKQQAEIKAMVATQEEERKRISRDLHDDVGTKLSALKLFVSSLHEKAANINNEEIKSLAKSSEQFITEAMQDVRQLLLNLSPTVLEEFGYTTAVEGLINKINETKQIAFTLVVFGMTHRMQKDYELALYRITQELVNNVLKHSAAKNVSLQIGQRDEKIILMIEDDGKGFDVNAHRDGYGLHNLDARTRLMHGMMNIDSQPGKGTSVLIEIPYNFNGV